ncbi:methyl-accepting chemotaxis protein [Paenibacillus sp. sgz500958]|uniref:methyl-accepting chemotaxis protein n=1 Tax=Paenibacillus sp. sgz500958 TaxID=3242475 RepID=UPI0036D3E3E1
MKRKLIVLVVILVFSILLFTNLVSNLFITRDYAGIIDDKNQGFANAISTNVTSFIEASYGITSEISDQTDIKDFNAEAQKSILERSAKRNSQFDLLYIQGIDGMQTARSSGKLGNRADRWWFKEMMEKKTSFVSKSYYSLSGNTAVTSIFHPIVDESGAMTGILGSDIKLDALQQLAEQNSLGNGSYIFIIDGEGTIIAHPNKQYVEELYNLKTLKKTVLVKDKSGKVVLDDAGNQKTEEQSIEFKSDLSDIAKKALSGETGTGKYLKGNIHMVAAYNPITLPGTSDKWAVIAVQEENKAFAFATDIRDKMIWLSLLLSVVASVFTWFVAHKITTPILRLMKIMEKAAHGDLTERFTHKSKDELGRLSVSYNNMMDKIEESLRDISIAFSGVIGTSKVLEATTRETAISIGEVARAVNDVADGAEQQTRDTEDGVQVSAALSQTFNEVAANVQMCKEATDTAHSSNQKGIAVMEMLMKASEESAEAAESVGEIVEALGSKASTIEQVIQTLTSIATQTNLLALNAGIEAARAGESGRGFAVVAAEIRKLAEGAAAASSNIGEIISGIAGDIKQVQLTMDQSKQKVTEQLQTVEQTNQAFQEIADSVLSITERTNHIVSQLKEFDENREQISSIIQNIAGVSQSASASTEEICAATEEQAAAMDEIQKLSELLNDNALLVERSINIFKLGQ